MKKRILLIVAIMLIGVIALVGCSAVSVGEVNNGTLDGFKSENVLSNWTVFQDKSGSAVYDVKFKDVVATSDDVKFAQGKYIDMSVTEDYGVYHLRQRVKMDEGKIYKFSYSINLTSDFNNFDSSYKVGAFAGFLESPKSKEFYNTSKSEGWKSRSIFITVDNTGTYTLALGVGLEGEKGSRGNVLYDNIKLEVVESAPGGIEPVSITSTTFSDGIGEGIAYTILFSLFSIVACMAVYYLIKRNNYKATLTPANTPVSSGDDGEGKKKITAKQFFSSSYFVFTATLIGMFLVRFLITYVGKGMSDQLEQLGDYALKIKDVGLANAYSALTTSLPYGMVYIYGIIGYIADASSLASGSMGMFMLLRLPQLLADLVVFYLIFTMVGKHLGYKQGALVAGLFAVLPAIFSLSATWGMNSSLPMAFILGAVYCMSNKNYWGTIATTTFAIIFNPLAIIVLPIVLTFLGYYLWKEKNKQLYVFIPLAVIGAIVAFYLLGLPLTLTQVAAGKPFFIFDRFFEIFNQNLLVSNSVFSFFSIFTLGSTTANTATIVISAMMFTAILVGLILMYLKSKNRLDWMGMTAAAFIGYSFFGVGSSFEMMAIGIVILLVYAVLRDDKRLYKAFSIFALMLFINVGIILTNSGVLGAFPGYQPLFKNDWIYILGSVLTLFAVVYYSIVTYDIMVNNYVYEMEQMSSFKQEMLDTKINLTNRFDRIFKKKK